jgi:hypothetical protein
MTTIKQHLQPGSRVRVLFRPENAAPAGVFGLDEQATIVEAGVAGLLARFHLHNAKGGDTLAFVSWHALTAVVEAQEGNEHE